MQVAARQTDNLRRLQQAAVALALVLLVQVLMQAVMGLAATFMEMQAQAVQLV